MTDDTTHGMRLSAGMTERELRALTFLQGLCNAHDGLDVKLNWRRLRDRPGDRVNDFLWFEDGQLVGFLGLYQFIPSVIEVSGVVHPAYRRRGIFRQLFAAALRECAERGVGEILLICERKSPAAIPFAKSMGGEYRFSEFRMEWQEHTSQAAFDSTLHLRPAGPEAAREIARQNHIYFGVPLPEDDVEDLPELGAPECTAYFAEVDGVVVGKAHVHVEQGEGWVSGLGVLPEYRRRGYGRAILRQAVALLIEMQPEVIALEVETENGGALTLYRSCGFEVVTGYDYYAVATGYATIGS